MTVTGAEIDTARRVFGAIVAGGLIGTAGHEALHAATARVLGGAWRVDRLVPPRVQYVLPADAPRYHDHLIRLAPQLAAWPMIGVGLWVGWPPVDLAHVADWATLLALGAGGHDDYATIVPAARAWLGSWGQLERLLAVVFVGGVVGSIGAATGNAVLYLWGGIVGAGVLTGLMLAEPHSEA
jgi:hypothetical protein